MTRVKVCGITRMEDAMLAAELGASAVGFVFWPRSPRFIEPQAAATIIHQLPAIMSTVGVFVNQPADDIRRVAEIAGLSAIQLHGDEPIGFARELLQPVIKAIPVADGFLPESLDAVPQEITVLLDAHDPVKRGGTGHTIDWSLAEAAAARRPVFLSGGLTPANVREAIDRVKPYAVDLSSGVESSSGIKDPGKLRALFGAIR